MFSLLDFSSGKGSGLHTRAVGRGLCPVLSCLCHSLRDSSCTPERLGKVSLWLWCQWDITSCLLVALTSGPFPGGAAPAAWTDTNVESHCLELWQCVTLISPVPSVSHSLPLSPGAPFQGEQRCSESSGLALHAQLQTCLCLPLCFQAAEGWEHLPAVVRVFLRAQQ